MQAYTKLVHGSSTPTGRHARTRPAGRSRRQGDANKMKIKELKKGDFFTKKELDAPKDSQVWIRGDYDRSSKRYERQRFDDACSFCYLPGTKEVFTGFTF